MIDPTSPEGPPARRWVRPLLLAVAITAAVTVTLATRDSVWRDPLVVRDALRGAGWRGQVLFVGSMWLIQPFGPPGFLWMIPAGFVWPTGEAMALSWVGNIGASSIAFGGVRWLARERVARRIPAGWHRFDARLEAGGVGPVVIVRLITGQLPVADWVLGLSSIRWPSFLVGTAIGIVPWIYTFVVGGAGMFAWLAGFGLAGWLVAATVTIGGAIALRRWLARPVA